MTWEDLKLTQYFKIIDILNDVGDAFEQNLDLIDCIWNIDSSNIPFAKLSYYLNELEFLQNPYKPNKPKNKYTIGGLTFIPTLDVSAITTAQYIDLQELLKIQDKKLLLNVLFIREGEEYGQNDYSELLWDNLRFVDYADVNFFYNRLLNSLMRDTLLSSKKTMKKMYRKEKDPEKKQTLLNNMAQIQQALFTLNEDDFIELPE